MPPRPFGKVVSYRLRVSYKVMVDTVEVESALRAEIASERDEAADKALVDAAFAGIMAIIEQSRGTDVQAVLVTVDQHGNTRQAEYEAP